MFIGGLQGGGETPPWDLSVECRGGWGGGSAPPFRIPVDVCRRIVEPLRPLRGQLP